jgi:hypothetical protein
LIEAHETLSRSNRHAKTHNLATDASQGTPPKTGRAKRTSGSEQLVQLSHKRDTTTTRLDHFDVIVAYHGGKLVRELGLAALLPQDGQVDSKRFACHRSRPCNLFM